ncbi:MAG: outer membrane lipoprotein carrier protein LolA [Alphaproteobacteria bacterium]
MSALLLFGAMPVAAQQRTALSAADQATIDRVEDYLNSLRTIQSRFVQANPDGSYLEGSMYLQRPGKLRFEYDPPSPYLIVASGSWFMYVDRELGQPNYMPIEKTPAYFILRPNFNFGEDLRVTSLQQGENVLQVELEQASEPDAGQVMLIFTESPLELRKWRVIDSQGGLTDTTLINPRFGVSIPERLFEYQAPPLPGID